MTGQLLDALDDAQRSALIAASRRRRFTHREVLFHEGDPGRSLHMITKGFVAIRACAPLGDTVTLAVLGPGEAFGELALLGDSSDRTASAVALASVETLSWQAQQIDQLRRETNVDQFFEAVLVEQVRRLTTLLVEALHLPVEARVLRRLAALAELFGSDATTADIPLTQEDLASLAGTSRPTANRILREAERSGIVGLSRGSIAVTDTDRLRSIAHSKH